VRESGHWAKAAPKLKLEIVKRTEHHKFVVLPRRWVVERTFAWITRSRLADWWT
jgi:transposase